MAKPGEAETSILDECANRRVGVDKIASRLLPPLGIRNKIVHVAVDDLTRLTAGPVINLGRRPRAAASLVARLFGSFAFNAREPDFIVLLFGNCMHVISLFTAFSRTLGIGFERNHLKRHAKELCYFLCELVIRPEWH
jgi:hypothetical protein